MTKLIFVADPGPAGAEDPALLDVWNNLTAAPDGAKVFKVDTTTQIKERVRSVFEPDSEGIDAVMIVGHGGPGLLTLRRKPEIKAHKIWFDAVNANVSSSLKGRLTSTATIQLIACSVAADEVATTVVNEGSKLIGSLASRADRAIEATFCALPSSAVTAAGATGIAILTARPDPMTGISTIAGNTGATACDEAAFTAPTLEFDESRRALLQEYFPDVAKLVWDEAVVVLDLSRHLFAATRWRTRKRSDGPPLSVMLFSTGSRHFCAFESEPGTLPAVEVPLRTLESLTASLPSTAYASRPATVNDNSQRDRSLL